MNQKLLSPVCVAAGVGLWAAFVGQPSAASQIKVRCETINGTPTTVLSVSEGGQTKEGAILHWSAEVLPPSENPQELCQQVSPKLESAYSQNEVYLATGKVDGKPSVCAETTSGSGCNRSNVLFSLEPNENGDLSEVNKVLDGILNSRLNQGESKVVRGDGSSRHDAGVGRLIRLIFGG
ncbi:MAG: COP23 domain-containing protein [Oscillatoria princeps RMCB-10]|jgi:hypothetical protein|nr:COP23 domain-containing protein [Oscillatoria princeps RMCB-10]